MEAKAKLDQSGWLSKEGGDLVKSWKKRWFCIEKGDLVYYKKEAVCGLVNLIGCFYLFGDDPHSHFQKQGECGRIPLAASQTERSTYKKYVA
jgi:hypothetical protein